MSRLASILASLLAGGIAVTSAHAERADDERQKLLVLPAETHGVAVELLPPLLDELVLQAAHRTDRFRIVGVSDINAALWQERQADLLGCTDISCMTDMGRALAADGLLVINLGWLDGEWLLSTKIVHVSSTEVNARATRFIAGGAKQLVHAIPSVLEDLFRGQVKPKHSGFQCYLGNADECESQCARGHPGSCYTLGFMAEKGRGVERDDKRAAKLYRSVCDKGHGGACSGLGVLINRGAGGLAADPALAAQLHRKGCEAGHPRGCYNLGVLFFRGHGVPVDRKQARSLYEQACAANDAYCGGLAALYRQGTIVKQDWARARELYARACEAGGIGCSGLGFMLRDGEGGEKDLVRAGTLFERSCTLDGLGCAAFGQMVANGVTVPKNTAQAIDLFARGCSSGHAEACHNQARALALGEGARRDDRVATELFRQACDRQFQPSCVSLARRIYAGLGVPSDAAQGKRRLEAICARGERRACEERAKIRRAEESALLE